MDDVSLPRIIDVTPLSIADPETDRFLAEHAEAIRVLGRRVVGDIIEIGNRLIAVKDRLDHGLWLPWIEKEFGWGETTARKFMAVADSFGKSSLSVDLPIDASALYLLAGPTVPTAVREQAIAKAEDGTRITKEEADRLIRESVRDALRDYRSEQDTRMRRAIEDATERLRDNNDALRDEIERIKQPEDRPNIEDVCKTIERNLGITKLSSAQYRALAEAMGQTIVVGNKSYDPVPREKIVQNEEHLRISSKITEALEVLAGAPPPEAVIEATWPVQRKQHDRVMPGVINWLNAYLDLLSKLQREEWDAKEALSE